MVLITFSPLKLLYWIVRSTIQEYIPIYIYKNIYIYCIHCIVYIHPRLKLVCNIVSSSRLDAKDGGLALLKISACRLFQKVLYELVGELDKLEDTKAKHEAEDAAETGKKLQEVHPWDAFVHLHLGYRCVSAYCIYVKRDSMSQKDHLYPIYPEIKLYLGHNDHFHSLP